MSILGTPPRRDLTPLKERESGPNDNMANVGAGLRGLAAIRGMANGGPSSMLGRIAPYINLAVTAPQIYNELSHDNRQGYSYGAYDSIRAAAPFLGPAGMAASALMSLPVARREFDRDYAKPLERDNKSGYTDLALGSNPMTAWINPVGHALGLKSLGEALFGKHKDIYQRDQTREFLKDKGFLNKEGELDVNGTMFDFDPEVGYNEAAKIENKNTAFARPQQPGSYADNALQRGWHATYDVDLTNPNAVAMSTELSPLSWALGGDDTKRQSDLNGMLTNAVMAGKLDPDAARKWMLEKAQSMGMNQDQLLAYGKNNLLNQSGVDDWDKTAGIVGMEGAVLGGSGKSPDPNGIGAGWIDPSDREAFIEHTKQNIANWGGDPNAQFLDANGYIIDPNAQKMHGLSQQTIDSINQLPKA